MWRSIASLLLAVSLSTVVSADDPLVHKVLTSAKHNIRVDRWNYGHDKDGTTWSIDKYTLHGGKQEGVDVIVVDNGNLKMTIVPTRGMSILSVVSGDVRLGWNSPVKEVVHPRHINLSRRGGLGWLDGFNEWMVRCGLEFAGHPGTDKFINNVGDEAEMELTLHGRIGNTPASEVEVLVDRKPPHRIRIRGRVNERMFYGPKLELVTEISTVPGSDSLRIDDTVINHGDGEQEFQIIYHTNFGRPLLEKGAQFVGAIKRVTPFNDHAAEDLDTYTVYGAPTPGYTEQVYNLYPYADKNGRTTIMLKNAAGDKAASMSYPVKQLPYICLWKNTLTEKDGYVTGLEPATGFPYNRGVERKAGRVPKLAAGASRRFTIDIAIHRGKKAVAKVSAAIAAIAAGRKTQVDRKPEKIK